MTRSTQALAPSDGLARLRAQSPSVAGRTSLTAVLAAIVCADTLGRLHEMLPYGGRIPIAKILFPIVLLLLVTSPSAMFRFRALRTPQGFGLLLFGIAAVLAVPMSLVRGAAFQYMLTFGYGVVPYVLIVAAGARNTHELKLIFRAIAIAVICLAGVMVAGGGFSEGSRLSAGLTYDPNDIALVAVVCLPFATTLFREPTRIWRLVGVVGACSAIIIVVLSASRGGVIAAGMVLLVTIVRSRYSLPRRWKLLLIPGSALVLMFAPPVFWERVTSMGDLSSDYNVTSDGGRVQIWKRGVKTFLARPIVGVGGGLFASADGLSPDRLGAEDQSWHTAHNSVLQIGVELGIFGLAGFLVMHLPTLRAASRARRLAAAGLLDNETAALGEVLFLSIIGFHTGAMFLSAGDSYASFTLGALGMSYTSLLRARMAGFVPAAAPAIAGRAGGWRSARGAVSALGASFGSSFRSARLLPAPDHDL